MSKIQSQAVLVTIVILAIIFFISGLLHLLFRFLMKHRSSSPSVSQSSRYPEVSGPDAFRRQLRQLFHLHDSGLDQASIDALPVFSYKDIAGLKEPFDCAVCLCEFSQRDKLRLLPMCSHAFHIDCIDTWLQSNSTCPLCRGGIFTPGFGVESPAYALEDLREEDEVSGSGADGFSFGQKTAAEGEITSEKRVFPVRLGKYKGSSGGDGGRGGKENAEGETSSRNLDARRCYSMGSFQYVVADLNLQVALCHVAAPPHSTSGDSSGAQGGNSSIGNDVEGKKINRSKGESFSVSKIWLWSKKGNFPGSADNHFGAASVNVDLALPERT